MGDIAPKEERIIIGNSKERTQIPKFIQIIGIQNIHAIGIVIANSGSARLA
jgi:hypothetical protein